MKRWLLIAGILLWAATVAWLLIPGPESLITTGRFESLKVGMTQSEVERILGGPARDEIGESVIVWAPRGDALTSQRIRPRGTAGGILLKEDSPGGTTVENIFLPADFPDSVHERVWLSEDLMIAVLFDEDGRLLTKHSSDVTVLERPSALDWLRTRF